MNSSAITPCPTGVGWMHEMSNQFGVFGPILFAALQRYFIAGLTASSVK